MTTPLWRPNLSKKNQMIKFMAFMAQTHHLTLMTYDELYQWSIEKPALFWQGIVDFFGIHFDTPAHTVLSTTETMLDTRWFEGASFNFAKQLLQRQDSHPALVSIDEFGNRQVLSYQALNQQVAHCANGLQQLGIGVGDRIAALLPNVSYTIIAMLASASLGAIWSSCSPDFGTQAALDRLGQVEPKVLFITDGHYYRGKQYLGCTKITELGHAIPSLIKIVICPVINVTLSLPPSLPIVFWQDFLQPTDCKPFASLPFAHPLYILFSSGTTGKPKCIIHGAGGTLLQHLKELGLHSNITDADNLFFYTTCGWMMWNWMVSVLALGATLTLYEGAPTYPDSYRLFDLIDHEKITVFGTSAKFISTVEKNSTYPNQRYQLTSLVTILSTGSPLLPKNYDFVYRHIKADVQLSSISGGTDIVSCFALGNPMLAVYRGELQCRGLGMAVEVFNDLGEFVLETQGELVCTQAFPSMPIGFWHDTNHAAYKKAYFSRFDNVWTHGDFAKLTKHCGVIIYGRSDTTLNPGGVRIGTAEIYRQVEKIADVLDSVVIGQDWQDDSRIVLFVVLKANIILDDRLKATIRETIQNHTTPRHVPAKIIQVPDIPRTMSGKVVELAVKQAVHGQAINNIDSLANPDALAYFRNHSELTQ